MIYIVDRIEGSYAVCEDKCKQMHNLKLDVLPAGVVEGSKIEETDEGYVLLDNALDRERIKGKMKALFKD